jgi:hypothetical protein
VPCAGEYSLCQHVVKGDDHAAGDVQELRVDLQHLGRGGEVLLEAVGRGAKQHQGAAHADNVLLTLEDVGDVHLDARVLVLLGLPHLGEHAAAGSALVVGRAHDVLLVVGVRELGRGADECGQRLLRLPRRALFDVVPLVLAARRCGRTRRGARPAGLRRRVADGRHRRLVRLQQLVEDAALGVARDGVVLVGVHGGQRQRQRQRVGTAGCMRVEQLFGIGGVPVLAAAIARHALSLAHLAVAAARGRRGDFGGRAVEAHSCAASGLGLGRGCRVSR